MGPTRDKDEPTRRVPNNAIADPNRANFLRDSELPQLAKAMTDNVEDKRAMLLIDTDDPIWKYSTIDFAEAIREAPKTEKPEPNRAIHRKANDAPKMATSNTESDDPSRAKLRNDRDLPTSTQSTTEKQDPMRLIPKRESVEPMLLNPLKDRVLPNPAISNTAKAEPN
jgi:hypothetical protein